MAVTDIIGRTDADALIPVPVRKEIIKALPAQSAALSLARKVTMSTKKDRQPVLSALPQAFWVSSDTGLKQTTKAEWQNKFLEAEELAVIVPVPEAVLADSDFDIWGEVKPLIVEALGHKLDQAVLFGEDQPASFDDSIVEGATAANRVVTRGTVEENGHNDLAADIGSQDGVLYQVETSGFSNSGFAARTTLKAAFRGLRDQNGALLFQPSLQAGTPATLYGDPIYYPDANGSFADQGVDLIAGDWSKAVIGLRQDITFKLFTEGVISNSEGEVVLNLMQQDSVAMRVVARYGFAVANPISRQVPDDGEAYPFAVLESEGS